MATYEYTIPNDYVVDLYGDEDPDAGSREEASRKRPMPIETNKPVEPVDDSKAIVLYENDREAEEHKMFDTKPEYGPQLPSNVFGNTQGTDIEWQCDMCTYLNPLSEIKCQICGALKSSQYDIDD